VFFDAINAALEGIFQLFNPIEDYDDD